MTKITYGTKTAIVPQVSHATQLWAEDVNEIKTVVNANDTVDTSASATVLFDEITGYRHGTWVIPITGDITLDETGAVEGGVAVVIWRGASNPTFLSGTVQSESGIITEDGVYSIYIHYLNGRFNVNIFNVEDPGQVAFLFSDTFDGSTIDTAKWAEVENTLALTQNNELIGIADTTAGSTYDSSLTGQSSIALTSIAAISFDLDAVPSQLGLYSIGITKDSDQTNNVDRIAILRSTSSGNVILQMRESSVNTKSETVSLDISTAKTFKITITGSTVKWWYWNTSWTQLGTSGTHTSTGNWFPGIAGNSNSGESLTIHVDNYYITDADFSTQYPL